jgi:hypothetical protein
MKNLLALAGLALSIGANADTYQHDDGTGEVSIGWSVVEDDLIGHSGIWLNAFQVVPGAETINSISVAYGGENYAEQPVPQAGALATVHIWTDPTGDGDPTDAVLQQSISSTIQNPGTNTFIEYDISPLTLSVGDWFFVGIESTGFAVATDISTGSAGNSWGAFWTNHQPSDPTNMVGANLFGNANDLVPSEDWDFLIRAKSVVAAPAPATFFYSLTPCRLASTNKATDPAYQGPIVNEAIDFYVRDPDKIALQAGTVGGCGVPPEATALSLNVTSGQNTKGRMVAYPTGAVEPSTSLINFSGSNIANSAILEICTANCDAGDITISVVGRSNISLDVSGYFAPLAQ